MYTTLKELGPTSRLDLVSALRINTAAFPAYMKELTAAEKAVRVGVGRTTKYKVL